MKNKYLKTRTIKYYNSSSYKDSSKFWGVMRNLLRKTHPVANITITQWQNYFESLLNMTGNSPENEAGIDGQDSRTEDYYETEIRDMARQKHSGETVISCYKKVTMREKKIERGRGLLTRIKSQRDKEIETETTQKTKEETETQKNCVYLLPFLVCLLGHLVLFGTQMFVVGHCVLLEDTMFLFGTQMFVVGHCVLLEDTMFLFGTQIFSLGTPCFVWETNLCCGTLSFAGG